MTTERRNISQPSDWWTAFERTAQQDGLTLSEWIGECCRANVPDELSERPPANRPKRLQENESL